MNVHEVAGLLAYFGSAWPSKELPDDTADVWAMELVDVNPDYGREAAKNLVRSLTFFPSIAEFLDECRRIATTRRATPPVAALPQRTEPPDLPTEIIADLRVKLAQWKGLDHRYTGPNTDKRWREPVVLEKSRCSRCGQMTVPYTHTLEPKEVDPPAPHPEQTGKPFKEHKA